jgi:hypothetical protein
MSDIATAFRKADVEVRILQMKLRAAVQAKRPERVIRDLRRQLRLAVDEQCRLAELAAEMKLS